VQDLVAPNRARRILGHDFAAPDLAESLSGYRSFGVALVGAATAQGQARISRLKAVRS
jgi:hypothetical protein